MNTTRFNPFNQIHKGLRALLYDTALALQHTDFTNEETTRQTFIKVEKTLSMFDGHAEVEDSIVFPKLNAVSPDIIEALEQEHVTDHQLGKALRKKMLEYCQANEATVISNAGRSVFIAFNEFIAFNLSHMNKEETIVNEALWANYSDDELKGMVAAIAKELSPEKNREHSRWMLKGNGDHEISVWLTAVQSTAPHFVFQDLCELAAETLPEGRWNNIQHTISTSAGQLQEV